MARDSVGYRLDPLRPFAANQQLDRDGDTAFRASLVDVRLGWRIDPRQRIRLALQGSDVVRGPTSYAQGVDRHGRDAAAQLIYSYKVNPRTAFYAGIRSAASWTMPTRVSSTTTAACS